MTSKDATVNLHGRVEKGEFSWNYEITVNISWSERSELIAAALAELAQNTAMDDAKLDEIISRHIRGYFPKYQDPA